MSRRLTTIILVLSIANVLIFWVTVPLSHLPMGRDAWAYFGAARAVTAGISPYSAQPILPAAPPYLYPPLLALVLAPIANLPVPLLTSIWLVLVAISLILLIPLLKPLVGWHRAIAAVLCFYPAWKTFYDGQINGFVAVLLLCAIWAQQEKRGPLSGVALALGILLKVVPIFPLLMLVWRGHIRSLVGALVTLASVALIAAPWIGADIWITGFVAALRSNRADDKFGSLTSLLYAVTGTTSAWLGIVVLTLLFLITLWHGRSVSEPLAVAAAMLVPLIAARVVWSHHGVMALPALALIWSHEVRARPAVEISWAMIAVSGLVKGPLLSLTLLCCWIICLWPRRYDIKAKGLAGIRERIAQYENPR
jgi:hypothetical protein